MHIYRHDAYTVIPSRRARARDFSHLLERRRHAQALKALKAEITELRGEMVGSERMGRAEERIESVRGACAQVASELVAVGGAQRLLQLEIAQSAADGERATDALAERLEAAVETLGNSIDIQCVRSTRRAASSVPCVMKRGKLLMQLRYPS